MDNILYSWKVLSAIIKLQLWASKSSTIIDSMHLMWLGCKPRFVCITVCAF